MVDRLRRQWNYNGIAVDKVGNSGGLALLWHQDVSVDLRSYSSNHIDVVVSNCLVSGQWRFTGFYGQPEALRRQESWDLLRLLSTQCDLPWVVGGDFNAIVTNLEKEGGNDRLPHQLQGFRDAISDCNLSDLGWSGYPFTWSNKREHPFTVRCRLDRVLANEVRSEQFPHARVHHLQYSGSDHIPVLLALEEDRRDQRRLPNRPFRFESMWVRREDCEDVIRNSWTDDNDVDPIAQLLDNTNRCRIALGQWSRLTVRLPQKRIADLQRRLPVLEGRLQTAAVRQEMSVLRAELEQVYGDNDDYWRQRSKVQWIREGDRNTRFFHTKASTRRKVNKVEKLKDMFGIWQERGEDIEGIIADYFAHIFQTISPDVDEIDEVLGSLEPRVSSEANQMLSRPFSADDVKFALAHMAPLKSPGPDGLPTLFFTQYWNILGSNVTSCVRNFLNNRILPSALNFTFIVLIPKIAKPEKITDYRPISLCNVIYKIGSKVIANRLKRILDSIISSSQSAFVPKRLIIDNVLVAYEINHYIRTNHSKRINHMAFKLDISKAYDRVEWIFLRKTLTRFGFLPNFVDVILLCISSVSYSFLFNGSQFGSLKPSRGLRQGDPLSPYLFLFCAEILISMIQHAVERDEFHGVQIASTAPIISNLCFADDTLLFCRADVGDASTLRVILDKYARISGQEINFEKTTMSFSPATPVDIREEIHNILGFQIVERHNKYLRMPASIGRTRKEIFQFLRDRLWARMKGWGNRHLSQAGKEVMVKSVLQAIPTYMMSCFMLPTNLLSELEMVIQNFWWGNGPKKKMAWISWQQLCLPKAQGGLGFRDLRCFNLALLTKQLWRILTSPDLLLSRVMKARYFPDGDIIRAAAGSRPSATWRSLLKAIPIFAAGLRRRIGDGNETSIWADPWLRDGGNLRVITRRPISSPFPDRVSDLINSETRTWDTAMIEETFWTVDRHRILDIPIGSSHTRDKWVWHWSKNGQFSVRSCYHHAMHTTTFRNERSGGSQSASDSSQRRWQAIWALKIPPKIRHFLWRACTDSLPTAAELHRRKVSPTQHCFRCGYHSESLLHVLFYCGGMRRVWSTKPFMGLSSGFGTHFGAWLDSSRRRLSEEKFALAVIIAWKAWETRNKLLHGEEGMAVDSLLQWSKNFLVTFRQALLPDALRKPKAYAHIWKPPIEGVIKCNFDAALPAGGDGYSVVVVARDWLGRCLWWLVRSFKGRPRPEECEAHEAMVAVSEARNKGWNSIIVEGDCLAVIESLQNNDPGCLSYGAYLADILHLAKSFNSCSFCFIKRDGNVLAHALASRFHLASCTEGLSLPTDMASIA